MRQQSMATDSERLGPLSDFTANYRPVLSSETRRKFLTATFLQEGHKPHKGARYQDILTDSLTVSHKVTSDFEFGANENLGVCPFGPQNQEQLSLERRLEM
jgi:hypothetical protein